MILLILFLLILTYATIPSLMILHFIIAPILIFVGIDLQERWARRKLEREEEKRRLRRKEKIKKKNSKCTK